MAMEQKFTATQKRALAIATVIALAFGAYFLRNYFILIVVAAVAAYLFNPLFDWLQKRFGKGLSIALTLLAALAAGNRVSALDAAIDVAFTFGYAAERWGFAGHAPQAPARIAGEVV